MTPHLHYYMSLLLLFFSLLVVLESLQSASGAACGDQDQRSNEVARICEADFDQGSEGLEACPEDCGPKLKAYIEDCDLTTDDLYFLVIATDKDACFDLVFGIYADLRGSDCEKNRKAYRPMWPIVCRVECTEKCLDLIEGVCNHCSGVLDSDMAGAVEVELSATAPHCPQAQCDLGSGSGSSGSLSFESNEKEGSSDSSPLEPSTGISGGQGRGTSLSPSTSMLVSLAFVCWIVSSSIDLLDSY